MPKNQKARPEDVLAWFMEVGSKPACAVWEKFPIAPRTAWKIIAELRDRHLLYIKEWTFPSGAGFPQATLAVTVTGNEVDAKKPKSIGRQKTPVDIEKVRTLRAQGVPVSEVAQRLRLPLLPVRQACDLVDEEVPKPTSKADLLALLKTRGKMDRLELREHFGEKYTQLGTHLKSLHDDSITFICEYRNPAGNGGRPRAVFALKLLPTQKDVPPPWTRAEQIEAAGGTMPRELYNQIVVQSEGVRQVDVELARRRRDALGPWAGL